MDSLIETFAKAVATHPDRIALIDGNGVEVTFAALDARARALAASWHAKGIRRGDRVLIAMGIGTDLYASLAALWSLGATVVLPEPAMGMAGIRHAARSAGVTAFCAAGVYGLLQILTPQLWFTRRLRLKDGKETPPAPSISPGDIALISFTSGTSGKPKAIPRSHGFLIAQFRALRPLLDSPAPERDLVAFPVFALINLAAGRCSILPNWKMSRLAALPPAQLRDWIESQQATRALLPPSLCEKLAGTDLPSCLHTIFTGGGPVFPDLIDRLQGPNPDLRITCVYGSTEAEPIAILNAADITAEDRAKMLAGGGLLAGRPVADIDLRIQHDEIQVAGDHVNKGYLDPAHDADNKLREGPRIWHRTGDAGALDDRGRLWLWGRLGSQVNVGDSTLFPFAAEVAARHWSGVVQSALMPTPTGPLLVIEGDATNLPQWQREAAKLGLTQVRHLAHIPTDRRHASKIDRVALAKLLG